MSVCRRPKQLGAILWQTSTIFAENSLGVAANSKLKFVRGAAKANVTVRRRNLIRYSLIDFIGTASRLERFFLSEQQERNDSKDKRTKGIRSVAEVSNTIGIRRIFIFFSFSQQQSDRFSCLFSRWNETNQPLRL